MFLVTCHMSPKNMKLQAKLNSATYELEIKREGGKVFANVDDRHYELESSEVEPDVYLFKFNHQIYQIYVSPNGIVNVGNHQFEIGITDSIDFDWVF